MTDVDGEGKPSGPGSKAPGRDGGGEERPQSIPRTDPDEGKPSGPGSKAPGRDGGGGEERPQSVRRTDPDEVISPAAAASSLHRALDLLRVASDPNEPWQDARRVLDATGDALDEGALALRAEGDGDGDDDGDGGIDEETKRRLAEVRWLSLMVSAARASLLGDAYLDIARKDPPPLFAAPSSDDRAGDAGGGAAAPLVVYASQTGTAESFARSFVKNLRRDAKSKDIDAVDMRDVTLRDVAGRRRVYFVVSTFGLGRPPTGGEAFYASLQLQRGGGGGGGRRGGGGGGGGGAESDGRGDGGDDGEGDGDFRALAKVKVAVAALGDSRFREFAAFGHNLAQELQALGAKPIFRVMTLDGKHGVERQEEEFRTWEERVRAWEGKVRKLERDQRTSSASLAENSCCVVS